MPRVENEYTPVLKLVMSRQLPSCHFTPEDVSEIEQETGLNKAQIEKWADILRFRMSMSEDKEAFLRRELHTGGGKTVMDCDRVIEDLQVKLANKTRDANILKEQNTQHTRIMASKDARIELLETNVQLFQAQAALWAKERTVLMEAETILKDKVQVLIQQLEANQVIHKATKILEDFEQQADRKRRHEA